MFLGKYYLRIALCTPLFGTLLLTGCNSDNNDDWGIEVPDSNQVRYTFQEKGASSKASGATSLKASSKNISSP